MSSKDFEWSPVKTLHYYLKDDFSSVVLNVDFGHVKEIIDYTMFEVKYKYDDSLTFTEIWEICRETGLDVRIVLEESSIKHLIYCKGKEIVQYVEEFGF